MGSLQVRLPLVAVAVLAASLAVAAFIVFEVLLLTGQDRLDDRIQREALELREHLALVTPGALVGSTSAAPTSTELVAAIDSYLQDAQLGDDHVTAIRVGDRDFGARELLTSPPSAAQVPSRPTELETLDTTAGEVRRLTVPLLTQEGDAAYAVIGGSLSEVRERAVLALTRIGAAAAIGLCVAGAAIALVIRRQLRPLHDLATAARGAELERLGHRVRLRGGSDEVTELAREFNRMLDRLETAVAEQRRFMAAVSHELRTPITVARGHLELLSDLGEDTGTGGVAETVALVRDELMQMQRIVADLMALGRAEDDDFVMVQRVNLREFFDDLQLRVVGLGTRGVVFAPTPDEWVMVDPDRLAQAVINLVVNADLHAAGRTRIEIGCEVDDTTLSLRVEDDGGGVEPALRDTLFDPFVSGEAAADSTGLGLSVVRAVAEAHRGRVELDTGAWGTRVSLHLPRGTTAARSGPSDRAGVRPRAASSSEA